MNIKKTAYLLNITGVKTIATDTCIRPDVNYGVNYHELRLNNKEWEFLSIPRERRSFGGEKVLKIFENEVEASKYYFLTQLHSYYFNQYIYPFEKDNKDINVGEYNFTLENLKEVFKRLNIDKKYYSFDEKTTGHSMFLERLNNEKSKVHFIGKTGNVVNSSLALEKWQAYDYMYKKVYYLYLFDQHLTNLFKYEEINSAFVDQDYKTLLTGVVIEYSKN